MSWFSCPNPSSIPFSAWWPEDKKTHKCPAFPGRFQQFHYSGLRLDGTVSWFFVTVNWSQPLAVMNIPENPLPPPAWGKISRCNLKEKICKREWEKRKTVTEKGSKRKDKQDNMSLKGTVEYTQRGVWWKKLHKEKLMVYNGRGKSIHVFLYKQYTDTWPLFSYYDCSDLQRILCNA